MKYTIYLFTLALTLNACSTKKKAAKAEEPITTQQVEEKKETSSEEKQGMTEEQIKHKELANLAKEYSKHADQEMPEDAIARIQRTNCFGRCPVYTLTVFKDGRLEYFGKRFTPRTGKFSSKVDKKKIEELINRAKTIGYNELKIDTITRP